MMFRSELDALLPAIAELDRNLEKYLGFGGDIHPDVLTKILQIVRHLLRLLQMRVLTMYRALS
jgi:hypothetical protein